MTRSCGITRQLLSAFLLASSPVLLAGDFNTIVVTTTVDHMNGFDQQCSLREAIHNVRVAGQFSSVVNECASGSNVLPNRIVLSSGAVYSLSISGQGEDEGHLYMLAVTPPEMPDLIIVTDGEDSAVIVQTAPGYRVLYNSNAWIEINNVDIFGGNLDAGPGGGIYNVAGILVLSRVSIYGNSASAGGGISNNGRLSINDSKLIQNSAFDGPGVVGGGAIFNFWDGSVEIRDSTIQDNQSERGGAIYNWGQLEIHNSSLTLNTSSLGGGGGGAIYSSGAQGQGQVEIYGSTLASNVSLTGGDGGAVFITGPAPARLLIRDSVLKSNQALGGGEGGAIWSDLGGVSTLRIFDSQLLDNSATSGGAIRQVGFNPVEISDSLIQGNTAPGPGGALHVQRAFATRTVFENNKSLADSGGAIYATVFTRPIESRFVGNRAAGNGGAIHQGNNADGTRDTLFEGNEAGGDGGAIYTSSSVHGARMRFVDNHALGGSGGAIYTSYQSATNHVLSQSLFHLNSATTQGGALWIRYTNASLTLANSTITSNSAGPNGGGGIYVHADTQGSGEVVSINNTIAGNLSGQDIVKMGDMTLINTIIASPDQNNCLVSLNNMLFTSLGNNISNDDSCLGLTDPSDKPNTDPMLGALGDFGGDTLTIELLPNSPAINNGNDVVCSSAPVNKTDQRGIPRPVIGCDIGAFEAEMVFADGFETPEP